MSNNNEQMKTWADKLPSSNKIKKDVWNLTSNCKV